MLAATALAFASCAKDTEITKQNEDGTHVVTVKALSTKTAIVEGEESASYVWTEGDAQYFHIYENGKEATNVSMAIGQDGLATFTATFANTTATSFEYTARYFKEESNKHNLLIVANQKPTLSSFDPSADLLIAQPQVKSEVATELQFALRRLVSVNKMTLKGLVEGEKIQTVELESSDKQFSAYWIAEATSEEDGSVIPEHYAGDGKKLTFDYSELATAVVGNDGTFAVYFVSAPVEEASFKVKVTTDQNIYERTLSSKLTLAVGQVKRFGIQLGDYGTPITTGTEYHLVESMDDLYDGATYIIVAKSGNEYFALGEQKTNNRAAVSVTENNGVITIDNSSNVYPVVIESVLGGYSILDIENNGYLYNNNTGKNYLLNKPEKGDFTTWTIEFNNSVASINNVDNTSRGSMAYNPNNGSPLFAAYGTIPNGGTANLALYVDPSTCAPQPRIIVTPAAIEVPYSGVESASDITFVLKDLSGTATATCDGTVVTEAVVVDNAIMYSVSANEGDPREGWIKITIGDVTASVTVSQAAAPTLDFTTIAKLNELGADLTNNQSASYNGKLTNAIISFVPDANNAIIKDETGSILVYKTEHGFLQGQTFSGELAVTVKMFNTTYEITAINASFSGEEAVVAPEEMTLAQLVGNFATYQNTYVKVVDLMVTGKNNKNLSVSNGGKTYIVFDAKGQSSATTGDIISVIGTIGDFQGTNQVKAWASSDITITTPHAPTTHTITINQPTGEAATAGCSISATVDGVAISSGASVEEGKTVTLAYQLPEGYTFGSWSVQGATLTGNTFVVGTSDVTVSAVFSKNTGGDKTYTITWNSQNNSKGVSSYTAGWSVTADGLTCNMLNWNNNNNGWNYVKAGNKTAASIATITTNTAIPEAIKTVKLTIDAVSATYINSLKLYVSSNSDFTSYDTYSFPVATGEKSITIDNPSSSCFYKIEADCKKGTSNGLITVSKLVFTTTD